MSQGECSITILYKFSTDCCSTEGGVPSDDEKGVFVKILCMKVIVKRFVGGDGIEIQKQKKNGRK